MLHGYGETVNRVSRDVKIAYLDLALAAKSISLAENNKRVLYHGKVKSRRQL